MTGEFADKDGAAFVAGGSGGLGAAVVRMLAARGSRVALTYRSKADAANALVEEIRGLGGEAASYQLDLGDAEATARALDAAEASFGSLHTVVYAAGPPLPLGYLSRTTPERFREQIVGDAVAFFNLAHAAIAKLRATGGSIVALGTTATTRAILRDGLSAGPKGAVHAVVKTIALEEGRFGVRANAVGIGMTNAGIAVELMESGQLGPEALEATTANTPLRRFGTAEEIAEAAVFLASDRASFITGQVLNVDGGYSV